MPNTVEVTATPIPYDCLHEGQVLEALIDGDYSHPYNRKQERRKKLLLVEVLEIIQNAGGSAVRIRYEGCQHGDDGVVVERLYSPLETVQ